MSLNHASKHLRSLSKKVFADKHVALGRIIERWEDIMGPHLSKRSLPASMSYRKNGKDQSITAQLSIRISSADALELSMQEPVILERINQILGKPRVVKLFPVHGDVFKIKPIKKTKSNIIFNTEELEKALSMVSDPETRKRLANLAKSMQSQD